MKWYYADGDNRVGPLEEAALDELIASGKVRPETLVWREGMPSWQPLRVVRDSTMGPVAVVRDSTMGPAAGHKVRYAGFWIRFAARCIDGVLLAMVNAVVKIPLTIMLGIGGGRSAGLVFLPVAIGLAGASVIISIGVGVLYEAYFVSTRGGTLGKLALGLRIVRADGGPVSGSLAVKRYFAQWLSALILLIGYIMAAFDDEKRALHDRLCETRVIHAR